MKFDYPLKVYLLDFIKSGIFDLLKLGQSKEWILNNFPDPDQSTKESLLDPTCTIWKYGSFEFYFTKDNLLYMIFFDGFNYYDEDKWYSHEIKGGESLTIESWIFENPSQLTLPFVMESLLMNKMDFITITQEQYKLIEVKVMSSGVRLAFHVSERSNPTLKDYKCTSVCLEENKSLT